MASRRLEHLAVRDGNNNERGALKVSFGTRICVSSKCFICIFQVVFFTVSLARKMKLDVRSISMEFIIGNAN